MSFPIPPGLLPQQPGSDPASTVSAYRWTLAWVVLAVMIWLFNKLQIGKVITYYAILLTLFFLVLTQYQAIAELLSPFSQTQGGTNGTAGNAQ